MRIKINILTPIHIGSGEEISPIEYFIDSGTGRFIRIKMDSLFKDPLFNAYKERFISEAPEQRYIGSIIDHSLIKRYPLYSVPISSGARAYIVRNQTAVKEFIKSAGRVYVPGSSLKGSILSAMIWHVLRSIYNANRGKITNLIVSGGNAYNELLDIVFSNMVLDQNKNRFSRWLDVSDSNFKKPDDALGLFLARVKGARRGGELPILYEAIKDGQSFAMEIKSVNSKYSEREILEIAHRFYLKVAEKDGARIDKEPYILRLGQGSTSFSTSLLILAEELGIRNYRLRAPRTRKRIDDSIPMGFVRINPV